MGLRPHPLEFAKFLKSLGREDVTSALHQRILEAHFKAQTHDDPMRCSSLAFTPKKIINEVYARKLLLLKLIMNISSETGESAKESTSLKPDVTQMLTFIKMSLDYEGAAADEKRSNGQMLDKLRIVEDEEPDADGDSDDEDLAPGLEGVKKSEHMSVTAVNLLLALLEREAISS